MESRATPRFALDADLTVVILDDPIAHRQAEAGALPRGLGREEGLEAAPLYVGRNSRTAIAHADLNLARRRRGTDAQYAALLAHRLLCIDGQIEQHLLELIGVADDTRQAGRQRALDAHAMKRQLMVDDGQRVLHDRVHVD